MGVVVILAGRISTVTLVKVLVREMAYRFFFLLLLEEIEWRRRQFLSDPVN